MSLNSVVIVLWHCLRMITQLMFYKILACPLTKYTEQDETGHNCYLYPPWGPAAWCFGVP